VHNNTTTTNNNNEPSLSRWTTVCSDKLCSLVRWETK